MHYTDVVNEIAAVLLDNRDKEGTPLTNGELLQKLVDNIPNGSFHSLMAAAFLTVDMAADVVHRKVVNLPGGDPVPREFVFETILNYLTDVATRLDSVAAAANQPAHVV